MRDIEANSLEPILLTTSEAAELLQVSEKTLWNHTAPRGNRIPVVRFGKALHDSRAAARALDQVTSYATKRTPA